MNRGTATSIGDSHTMATATGFTSHRLRLLALAFVGISAVLAAGCGAGVTNGDLQLVVADQTTENPVKDVVEITVSDGVALYPDSSAGGSPADGGEWVAGETLSIAMWANASDESPFVWTVPVPDSFSGESLTLVIEVEDEQVAVSSSALGITESFTRHNAAREAREAEAAAAASAAAAAEADRLAAEAEAESTAMKVRSEAKSLSDQIDDAWIDFNPIWDEHTTVYGDDDWATFKQLKRKFKDYTTEALADFYANLPNPHYTTDEVASLSAEWYTWWGTFIDLQRRAETAAGNNDSTAMDSVRSDEDEHWDYWNTISDRIVVLKRFSAADLDS
jgi:hypothetical protein